MVVDDEPDALELIREILDSMGISNYSRFGYAALKLIEQSSLPDLIFMDVQMPVLSGTETLRLIRERYQGIMVVAQSAHALVGDRERFMEEGYDEYLPKPFTVEQLAGIISTLFKDCRFFIFKILLLLWTLKGSLVLIVFACKKSTNFSFF